ncbi:MAG TPA: nucleotidyltransferase family protein [Bacillota bacterium]|nr:nucleotidyltransferase family protein [Bacillota bacterium]
MDKDNLSLEKIKQLVIPALKRHDVAHAAIFGSFVHGAQKEDSDVDILIEYNNDHKTLLDLVGLELELGDILGRPADVLTYDSLHPLIKENALKEQVVLF